MVGLIGRFTTMGKGVVQLVPVDAGNWRSVASVTPFPHQKRFVMPVTYYLCLCSYGDDWTPWAVVAEGVVVGHAMRAHDETDGSDWLGGLVIDAAFQGRGYGRAAVVSSLNHFTTQSGEVNAALAYAADNVTARDLYLGLGYVETGEMDDDEVVARLVRTQATD